MIKKVRRKKKNRVKSNFDNAEKTYGDILLTALHYKERIALSEGRILNKFYDDDLLVNMLIYRSNFKMNKIGNVQNFNSMRLLSFPSYIPLIEKKMVIQRHEFYWTYNTCEISCVKCNKPTIAYYDSFSLYNLTCADCKKFYLKRPPRLIMEGYMVFNTNKKEPKENTHKYAKNSIHFFRLCKQRQKELFEKRITRAKSIYDRNYMTIDRTEYTKRLNTLKRSFTSYY